MIETSPLPPSRTTTPWWRSAVTYQLYLRSFQDSDGDGIGDLRGAAERLDYLADLGVEAIWVNPWYLSPMVDGGYDVQDYRRIDPTFGTLADAEEFIRLAHRRGLRVITDLVPNHTSEQHPWFQAALAAEPGSPEHDRYVFRPGAGPDGERPPNDWKAAFGGPAWRRVVSPSGQVRWCLHLFSPEQPDLNWLNPEVRQEFLDILRFWLDRGVDGFRVDVANCIVKPADLDKLAAQENFTTGIVNNSLVMGDQPEVHDIYREWRSVLDDYPDDRMMIGEIWVPDPAKLALYLRSDEFHQVFNFSFLKARWSADEMREAITKPLEENAQFDGTTTWVLANHDVQRAASRYGGGPQGRRRARAAFLLLAMLPGSIYVYTGDELGLEEVSLPDHVLRDPVWERSGRTDRGRDGSRVPQPWAATEPSFGFTSGQAWLPQPSDWGELSVTAQLEDPASFLSFYRQALNVRRTHLDPGAPDVKWVDVHPDVLCFRRPGATSGPEVLVAMNLGEERIRIEAAAGAELLLSSRDLDDPAVLPPNATACWALP